MITRTIGPITVVETEVKSTIRVEIDNSGALPVVTFYRRQARMKGDAMAENSTYPIAIGYAELAKKSYEINGKTITAGDVYAFIRSLGDELDPLEPVE